MKRLLVRGHRTQGELRQSLCKNREHQLSVSGRFMILHTCRIEVGAGYVEWRVDTRWRICIVMRWAKYP